MNPSGSNKKVSKSLVAVSFAAVLSVYAAGYSRTRSAANELEAHTAERRPAPNPSADANPAPTSRAVAEIASVDRPSTSPTPPRTASDANGKTTAANSAKESATIKSSASSSAPVAQPVPSPSSGSAPASPVQIAEAVAPTVALPVDKPAEKIIAEKVPPTPPAPKWKDGTYYGWGYSRHGNIQAEVIVEGGRISARISECDTRYPCSVIEMLPPQVAQRQSPDVDYVSSATQSADAFYGAVVEALGKAK